MVEYEEEDFEDDEEEDFDEEELNVPIEYIDYLQNSLNTLEGMYNFKFKEYAEKLNDLNWGTTVVVALFIFISDAIKNTGIVLYLNVFIGITSILIVNLIAFIVYKIYARITIVNYINYVGTYRDKLIYLKNLYKFNLIKDKKEYEIFASAMYEQIKGDKLENYFSVKIDKETNEKRSTLIRGLKVMDWAYYICLVILVVFITLIPAYFIYIQYIKDTTI